MTKILLTPADAATGSRATATFQFPMEVGLASRGALHSVQQAIYDIGSARGAQTQLDVIPGSGWLSRSYTFRGQYSGSQDDAFAAGRDLNDFLNRASRAWNT